MKCTIPEISWHNRDPVYSVDIQLTDYDGNYKMATGGSDGHVIIWQLQIEENGAISVELLSDLTRHNKGVNIVRFSPDGQFLASGDDEASLLLWKRSELIENNDCLEDGENNNKEQWVVHKTLRGHLEDIHDLCWSKCSQFLISGSVDSSAIMWDINKGKNVAILKEHNGYVQGVQWDPFGTYIATMASDRYLRIYNSSSKKLIHKIAKCPPSYLKEEQQQTKSLFLFHDDTLKSYCRRLSFSPDGELLLVPSGIVDDAVNKDHALYIFTRLCFSKPLICIPLKKKYAIAVKFCPRLFKLRNSCKENCMINLPYRMVFAVATYNTVFFYDTEQLLPFGMVSDIHYTRLTDLSWSSDGRILSVSSTDGYCSLMSFDEDEIGKLYVKPATDCITPVKTPSLQVSKEVKYKSDQSENKLKQAGEYVSHKVCKKNGNVNNNEDVEIADDQKCEATQKDALAQPAIIKTGENNSNSVKKQARRISLITLSAPSKSVEAENKVEIKPEEKNYEGSTEKTKEIDSIEKNNEVAATKNSNDSTEKNNDVTEKDDVLTEINIKSGESDASSAKKQARRVPLITLSSPKSCKRKIDREN